MTGARTGTDSVTGFGTYIGTRQGDTMFSNIAAPVRFDGRGGNDTLDGGGGNDTVLGGVGNDSLTGFHGNDALDGSAGLDWLDGGTGSDTMVGGSEADTLIGGGGGDLLNGGPGADTFVYLTAGDSSNQTARDRIVGFDAAEDVIDLSALEPLTYIGATVFTAADQVRWFHAGNYTVVTVNLDNGFRPEMRIDIVGLHTLTEANFVF